MQQRRDEWGSISGGQLAGKPATVASPAVIPVDESGYHSQRRDKELAGVTIVYAIKHRLNCLRYGIAQQDIGKKGLRLYEERFAAEFGNQKGKWLAMPGQEAICSARQSESGPALFPLPHLLH
jgi:hypothetical protein